MTRIQRDGVCNSDSAAMMNVQLCWQDKTHVAAGGFDRERATETIANCLKASIYAEV